MKFKMNDRAISIEEVNESVILDEKKELEDGKGHYLGVFFPLKQKIYINKILTKEQKRKTLMHELTHCYIWCYMTPFENLNEEDICNIHMNSHDIIHGIVDKYFK